MKITNKHNLPTPYVNCIINDPYSHDGDISMTTLIKPPRIVQLTLRHFNDIERDVMDYWKITLGNAFHLLMEREAIVNGFTEERVKAKILDLWVSGQIDMYYADDASIVDIKTTSLWSIIYGGKSDWEKQLNGYAYLMRDVGFPVDKLQIFYCLTDWSKTQQKRINGCPKNPLGLFDIPLWPEEKQLQYLEERVKLHQECRDLPDNELPFCTPEERWERPSAWAVKKGENKRALRVLDTEEEAQKWIEKYTGKDGDKLWIEHRLGQSPRCENYCDVKYFCNQYEEMMTKIMFGEDE